MEDFLVHLCQEVETHTAAGSTSSDIAGALDLMDLCDASIAEDTVSLSGAELRKVRLHKSVRNESLQYVWRGVCRIRVDRIGHQHRSEAGDLLAVTPIGRRGPGRILFLQLVFSDGTVYVPSWAFPALYLWAKRAD